MITQLGTGRLGTGCGRTEQISRAVRAVDWIRARDGSPFHWSALGAVIEMDRRSAYRWLRALESNVVIEHADRPGWYRAVRAEVAA